jgi:hypothetical protein
MRLLSAACLCLALACVVLGTARTAAAQTPVIDTNYPRTPPAETSFKELADGVLKLAEAIKNPGAIKVDVSLHPDAMLALIVAIAAFPFVLWVLPRRPVPRVE